MSKKPVHLVFVEEKTKGDGVDHNKFYDMFEQNGECHCLYGRQQDGYVFGKTGAVKNYPMSKWDSIYSQKIAKGYEDKSYIYEDLITAHDSSKKSDNKYAPITNAVIAEIVERLQKYARDTIDANYSVKTGQVTKIMVDEVQKYLNKMTYATDMNDFNDLLLEIFKIIPRSMSRVDNYLMKTDSEEARMKIITREQDLIDVLRGQIFIPTKSDVSANTDDNSSKKTILEENGIIMEVATAEDIELIKSKLGSNASRLRNVWKVSNEKQKKAYEAYTTAENIRKRDAKLLWHGTRSENVWSILKTGLVLRPTNAVITGKMFGYGLYFAPSAQKSLGYTSLSGSYWAKGHSDSGFMILHAVAYGKPYDVYSFDSKYYNLNYESLRKFCPGANCLHAHKDKGMLRNDEIVVYREDQVMPLYLVELS